MLPPTRAIHQLQRGSIVFPEMGQVNTVTLELAK
jgi:hypothetical protein